MLSCLKAHPYPPNVIIASFVVWHFIIYPGWNSLMDTLYSINAAPLGVKAIAALFATHAHNNVSIY